jgi:hypothetical protein
MLRAPLSGWHGWEGELWRWRERIHIVDHDSRRLKSLRELEKSDIPLDQYLSLVKVSFNSNQKKYRYSNISCLHHSGPMNKFDLLTRRKLGERNPEPMLQQPQGVRNCYKTAEISCFPDRTFFYAVIVLCDHLP